MAEKDGAVIAVGPQVKGRIVRTEEGHAQDDQGPQLRPPSLQIEEQQLATCMTVGVKDILLAHELLDVRAHLPIPSANVAVRWQAQDAALDLEDQVRKFPEVAPPPEVRTQGRLECGVHGVGHADEGRAGIEDCRATVLATKRCADDTIRAQAHALDCNAPSDVTCHRDTHASLRLRIVPDQPCWRAGVLLEARGEGRHSQAFQEGSLLEGIVELLLPQRLPRQEVIRNLLVLLPEAAHQCAHLVKLLRGNVFSLAGRPQPDDCFPRQAPECGEAAARGQPQVLKLSPEGRKRHGGPPVLNVARAADIIADFRVSARLEG
mmetsp:Transcript_114120/g.317677  ORF Transcript_114120/g.317677 Transcript_114120/m.317677 type:complete len:320 (-) Transcript_114120:344-1303(-)